MPAIYHLASKIFTGETWLEHYAIKVEAGVIAAVLAASEIPEGAEIKDHGEAWLAPAFIDLQIYGANRKLLSVHPTADALQDLYDYCVGGGATLFQPTVATNAPEVVYGAIDAVRAYRSQGGKGVIGLHVEGPWISMEKRGAHLSRWVHAPSLAEAAELLEYGKEVISMITLAPEVCPEEVIRLVQSYGVTVAAGHSNASFSEANRAFNEWDIPVATHLYNAMSPLQHRQPGLVGAVLLHPKAMASIIPDGHHVDFAAVQIAYQMMGERLFVITDAVTETTEGGYRHHLAGNKYESAGILSGSALTMHQAFKNLVAEAGIPVEAALRMCSLYPARVMKMEDRYGKIAPGFKAQFLVLDHQLSLLETIAEAG